MKNILLPQIPRWIFLLVLLPLFAIPFISSNATVDPDHSLRGILFYSYAAILTLILLFARRPETKSLSNLLFLIPVALLVLMILVSGIAINFSNALKSIVTYALFPVLIFLFIIKLQTSSKSMEDISLLVTAFTLVLLAISMYQSYRVFSAREFDLVGIYDIRATLNHKNLFSNLLMLSLPFTVFNIYKHKGVIRYLSLFVLFVALVQMVIILTRSTWIALFVTSLVTLILFLILRKRMNLKLNSGFIVRILGPVLILVTLCSFLIIKLYDNHQAFRFQVNTMNDPDSQNIQKRLFLWQNTFKMIDDNSLAGVGPGNWQVHIPKYIKDDVHNNFGEIRYQTPHNDFLSVLAETGIAGLLLYLSALFLAIALSIRIVLKSQVQDDKVFALLVFGGIVSFITVSLFSAVKENYEILFLLSIVFAFLIVKNSALNMKRPVISKAVFFAVSFIVVALCVSAAIFSGKTYRSEKHIKLAVRNFDRANYPLCISEADKAYSQFITCDPTSTPIMWYKGNANFALGNYTQAYEDYLQAYNETPYNSYVLTNLGSAYAAAGRIDEAEDFFIKSIEIKPTGTDAINNLIAIYIHRGRYQKSLDLCMIHGYQDNSSPYHDLFLLTLKQKVQRLLDTATNKHVIDALKVLIGRDDWLAYIHMESLRDSINFDDLVMSRVSGR